MSILVHTGVGRVKVFEDEKPRPARRHEGREGHASYRTDWPHALTLRQYLDRRRADKYGPTHIVDLKLDQCRFPLWAHGTEPTLQFCGAMSIPEKTYCQHHYDIAHGKKAA